MSIPLRANVAHVVAQLLSRRATRPDELPDLMRSVELALTQLDAPDEPRPVVPWRDVEAAPVTPRTPRRRRAHVFAAPEPETIMPAPAPRLLRRADVVPSSTPSEPTPPAALTGGSLRGVVKWFDLRTRRGALRLPGVGGDVAIEPALLDEMAIPRLYKGQEVEATLGPGEPQRVVRLALPGGAWEVSSVGGVVHSRHAKTVVVELKRQALRRVAARAEAELLLGPSRAR